MPDQLLYAIEVILNGLMAGVLYALVALGFVLIFKASGHLQLRAGGHGAVRGDDAGGDHGGPGALRHLINAIFGTEIHHFGWHVPALLAIL